MDGLDLLGSIATPRACVASPLAALLPGFRREEVEWLADELGLPYPAATGCEADPDADPVLLHLASAVLSILATTSDAASPCVRHILLALRSHLVDRPIACFTPSKPVSRGGLSRRQILRAKELLSEPQAPSMTIVARECGLTRSHFSRAFKQSTGLTPQAWQLHERLQQAKALLAQPCRTIADIAVSCGFVDQSHLTRVFNRYLGITPALWRKSQRFEGGR